MCHLAGLILLQSDFLAGILFLRKSLMVVCLLQLVSWSPSAIADETLPCLDSSKECVEKLTQNALGVAAPSAIANWSKLKTLDDRIALIDRRLGVSKDSIDYAESKLWTNYLPSSTSFGGSVLDIINPFAWIKNLAGGGEMQRDRIAIAANWLATGGILNQNHPIPQFAPLVDWVKQQSNPTPKATCEQ